MSNIGEIFYKYLCCLKQQSLAYVIFALLTNTNIMYPKSLKIVLVDERYGYKNKQTKTTVHLALYVVYEETNSFIEIITSCNYTSFGWRKFFPENFIWNTAVALLSYSCMFQIEICSQQLHELEICKSVCMFIGLAIVVEIDNFRLFCSDDCRSWPREEKIINHGCWGKHAHIPDNDYWGICFMSCEPIFFCNYSYVIHTEYINIKYYFFHQLNIAHER